jgi:hypothetical protein
VAGPTDAEIIDTFLTRAARVVNSDLVDAAKARQATPYSVDMRILRDGSVHSMCIDWTEEDRLKALAVDLRPFFPWVDDQVKVGRVINSVLRSLTDQAWKQRLLALKEQHKDTLDSELFYSYWSIPADGWRASVNDRELAKHVINDIRFHETVDPRIRHILSSDHQVGPNHYAVTRMVTETIIIVSQLQAFIIDADACEAPPQLVRWSVLRPRASPVSTPMLRSTAAILWSRKLPTSSISRTPRLAKTVLGRSIETTASSSASP